MGNCIQGDASMAELECEDGNIPSNTLFYWAQVLIGASVKKVPWEFTKSPKDFLKTLFLNTFSYIG